MNKYKVLVAFTDSQDDYYQYNENDDFPRTGKSVSKKRLEELSSSNNKRKKPLIEEVQGETIVEELAEAEESRNEYDY